MTQTCVLAVFKFGDNLEQDHVTAKQISSTLKNTLKVKTVDEAVEKILYLTLLSKMSERDQFVRNQVLQKIDECDFNLDSLYRQQVQLRAWNKPKNTKVVASVTRPGAKICLKCKWKWSHEGSECPRCNPCGVCVAAGRSRVFHAQKESCLTVRGDASSVGSKNVSFDASLDTAASTSVANQIKSVSNYLPFTDELLVANGEALRTKGTGTMALVDNIAVDTVVAPDCPLNLVSVGQLVDQGLTVNFESSHAEIKNCSGKIVCHVPRADSGLWTMKVSQPSFAFAVPAAPIEKAEDASVI